MKDNSEYCIKINASFEEKQNSLCIDCIHYDSEACTCCYEDQ